MGHEIRRVPPNWEHPRYTEGDARRPEHVGQYRPCFDTDYETASREWKREFAEWETGTHPKKVDRTYEFWEYSSTPDRETCRPKFEAEPTWWQVYETVSEGCPVSPPFATREQLVDYLVEHGDFWGQRRGTAPPSRSAVEAFVTEDGWVPSLVFGPGGIRQGIEIADTTPPQSVPSVAPENV